MKKCRQCGMLSADTAVVCRHCNIKFSQEDKPVVAAPIKKKKTIFSIITVAIAVIAIATFALYQTGMLKTWSQEADKSKIAEIAEDFVKADFEKDTLRVKSYMFDQYIMFHQKLETFSLQDGKYISFYFSLYNPNISIQVSKVNTEFLKEDFDLYCNEIANKYSITPEKIASVTVEVQITDDETTRTVTAPMTIVEIEKNWYILPIL